MTEIEVIYNVTIDVPSQYRWLVASFLLTTVYSVRPAAGVISLCRVVCRQNRGFGSILDTGITCLSWSSPPHGATPTPPHLTSSPQYTECRWSFLSCWTVPESVFSHYSGHLVPSLWDLHMFYLLRPILTQHDHGCDTPILTTGLSSIQRSWSYLSLFCCFQPKFDVSCYCIVLGQRVAVWRCWINVWHDVCTSYLPTCQPPPPPLSLLPPPRTKMVYQNILFCTWKSTVLQDNGIFFIQIINSLYKKKKPFIYI